MRRFIYDQTGEAVFYVTGAGVFYNSKNQAVAFLQDEALINNQGTVIAWFDGAFLWDLSGQLMGFVKGAKQAGLELPKTKPLSFKPVPVKALFHPVLKPAAKPVFSWQWSEQQLAYLPEILA